MPAGVFIAVPGSVMTKGLIEDMERMVDMVVMGDIDRFFGFRIISA
jgi:hypothetical protein